ncbi:hypothetical protein [Streptomyces sp. NPDC005876]|uniref:hypothetical protein n=1 Tax=unclassified Streptomyces TaxID=2593676 RepID=UPI00340BBBB9
MLARRFFAIALAGALSLLGATVVPASASSAGVLDVTCAGSQSTTYTPALTLAPQASTIAASTQYGPCVSLSQSGLTSGSRSASLSYPSRSCLDLLDSGTVTYTITWNTGQTSTISGNSTATVAGAAFVVTITGTVTSGLFAGDSAVQVNTGPATDVTLCTLGLGSVSNTYLLVALELTSV